MDNPKPIFSLVISTGVSRPGRMSHFLGSTGGSREDSWKDGDEPLVVDRPLGVGVTAAEAAGTPTCSGCKMADEATVWTAGGTAARE